MKINFVIITLCMIMLPFTVMANRGLSIEKNRRIVAPQGKSHQWFLDGKRVDGLTSQKVAFLSEGNYSVVVEKENGVVETYQSKVIQVGEKIVTIFMIGDSTMADYTQDYSTYQAYYDARFPLTGWGQVFQQTMLSDSLEQIKLFLNADSVIVDNHARGGRSSRSFWEEGRWTTVKNLIKTGDFVIIQFGHNDASESHPDRYVDTAGYKDFLRLYVNETREKGGIPILATPVNRNYPWSGGKLTNVHGNYPEAMKQVGTELNVPLIDITQRSLDYFTEIGQDYVSNKYFMNFAAGLYPGYPDGDSDNTHFQPEGARAVARLFFEGLKDIINLDLKSTPEDAGIMKGSGWYERKYTPDFTLKAYPKLGYVFDHWSGDVEGNQNPMNIQLDSSINVTANYVTTTQKQYSLKVVSEEGEIGVNPFGGLYEENQNVTIEAGSVNGDKFYSWYGDYISTENPLNLTLTKDMELNALYIDDKNTVFPASLASGNVSKENSLENYTGDSYISGKSLNDSAVWNVYVKEEGRYGFFFRYINQNASDLYADLYVNGELSKSLKFIASGDNSTWKHSLRSYENLPVGTNSVKLVYTEGLDDLYIDYLISYGDALFDPANSINKRFNSMLDLSIYPNPVNEIGTLAFYLEKESHVNIKILNVLGQDITTISNKTYNAGKNEIEMGDDLSVGVYTVILTMNGISSNKRFIVK